MAIDYYKKIVELQNMKKNLLEQADRMIENGNFGADLNEIQNQVKTVSEQIDQVSAVAAASATGAVVPEENPTEPQNTKKPEKYFNSLGEQLKAIRNAAAGSVDERLYKVNNDVKGAQTGVGSDGGYAIQEDFAGVILDTAAETGEILKRVNRHTISSNANSMRWVTTDETDISETVFGGVQMHWATEGGTVNASKPKFKEVKCDLEKMMGFAYVTSEMLEDVAFMSSFLSRCFTVATQRLLESAIIGGSGSGQPLGILESDATVEVAKETSQTAATINTDNILKMWQRGYHRYRNNMVWLCHPDCEEQLQRLEMNGDSIWMPEGGLTVAPYQRVLGRPVIYTDQCSALGTAGDILLADLSKYILLTKGSARQDWSMHVEFLTDQQCFRMVLRCNGRPEVDAPVTLKNTTLTRSPFVTLADRA